MAIPRYTVVTREGEKDTSVFLVSRVAMKVLKALKTSSAGLQYSDLSKLTKLSVDYLYVTVGRLKKAGLVKVNVKQSGRSKQTTIQQQLGLTFQEKVKTVG